MGIRFKIDGQCIDTPIKDIIGLKQQSDTSIEYIKQNYYDKTTIDEKIKETGGGESYDIEYNDNNETLIFNKK